MNIQTYIKYTTTNARTYIYFFQDPCDESTLRQEYGGDLCLKHELFITEQ